MKSLLCALGLWKPASTAERAEAERVPRQWIDPPLQRKIANVVLTVIVECPGRSRDRRGRSRDVEMADRIAAKIAEVFEGAFNE